MELVNARRSRTVLTAANEGDIIAAVDRLPLSSHGLTQELRLSQLRDLELLYDSYFHQHNFSTCVSRLGSAPGRQLYKYKPSPIQPQFLQFTCLSNRSVILCYPYCAWCYSQCIIQHVHCVMHHLWNILTLFIEEWNIHCYVDWCTVHVVTISSFIPTHAHILRTLK